MPEVEAEDSTSCPWTLKLTEAAQAVQRSHRMEERQSHIMTNAESESERSFRTLTGKARMNAYKDIIAETERVKKRRRVGVERGAGDAL